MAKPSDFFVGVVDFFAIFLPGTLLVFIGLIMANMIMAQPHTFDPKFVLQAIPHQVSDWVVFLFASYVVGHFIFALGSLSLDRLYDHMYSPWKRRKGDPLKDYVEYIKRNSFVDATRTTNIDDQSIIGTFMWAAAIVRLKNSVAAREIDRGEADSKFFRSFTIALLLLIVFVYWVVSIYPVQPPLRLLLVGCLVLSVLLSLWRFMDLRWKLTEKTYQSFIAWELDSHTNHSLGYCPPATETLTRRKVHMLKRLWTRNTALGVLIAIFLVTTQVRRSEGRMG